jgi:hypothetical protein
MSRVATIAFAAVAAWLLFGGENLAGQTPPAVSRSDEDRDLEHFLDRLQGIASNSLWDQCGPEICFDLVKRGVLKIITERPVTCRHTGQWIGADRAEIRCTFNDNKNETLSA